MSKPPHDPRWKAFGGDSARRWYQLSIAKIMLLTAAVAAHLAFPLLRDILVVFLMVSAVLLILIFIPLAIILVMASQAGEGRLMVEHNRPLRLLGTVLLFVLCVTYFASGLLVPQLQLMMPP